MIRIRPRSVLKICLLIVCLLVAGGFFLRIPKVENATDLAMDTAVTITLYEKRNLFDILFGAGDKADIYLAEIHRIDDEVLDKRSNDSECYRFNHCDEECYAGSEEFYELLEVSLELADKTDGMADVTLGALIDLWDIEGNIGRTDYIPPSDIYVEGVKNSYGYEHVEVRPNGVVCDLDGLSLDFGALGKGYALDRLYEDLISRKDMNGAVIAMGGSILAYGQKNDHTSFKIGIRDPEGGILDTLGVIEWGIKEPVFVSTSGNYERYTVSKDGKIYSHILNPVTGRPAENDLLSVTVLAHSGLVSDGLSTACLIAGEKEAEVFLREYDAEAIYVYNDHSIHVTDGLKELFTLTDKEYHIE